jgi:hypothetical protein
MMTGKDAWNTHRRQFLQSMAAVAAGFGLSTSASGQACPAQTGTVRDKLWVFCNPRNADYNMVRRRSAMSPLESAVYLGIPNILMVNQYPGGRDVAHAGQEGWYEPWEPPLEQYAFPLKILKRVAWSIVGASGVTTDSERKQVIDMALHTPNFVGVYMDDFFHNVPDGKVASLSVDELRGIQEQLKGTSKKLDLYVTLYTNQLDRPIADYLSLIDVVTLWTWDNADLGNLEANLSRLERLAPKSRKLLGCYTAATNKGQTPPWTGLPIPAMQQQCETALRLLRDGRIDGIIIYGCTTMDLNWKSVDWAREWIERVGDAKLP